jgi:chromate transporter
MAFMFLSLGLTAFGGLAMVEPIRREVVEKRAWVSHQEFLDGLALCQVLPGATVVQLAAYLGYRLGGAAGALTAAAAFIFPAAALMLGLSFLYFHYGELIWIKLISRGLGAVVIALLLQALWNLGQAVREHYLDLLIALGALLAFWLKVNYLAVFLGAAAISCGLRFRSAPAPRADFSSRPPSSLGIRLLAQLAAALGAIALGVLALGRLDALLRQIAWIFLKIGAISFGGGYVMIPILQWEVVDRLGWLTTRQFLDGILLGYATPGPLIILATFVGYWVKGWPGGLVATVAVFLPPILAVIFAAPIYQQVKESRLMRPAIQGILAALVGMLALVAGQMGRAAITDWPSLALLAGAAVALMRFKLNLFYVIAAAAACSFWIFKI